MKEAKTRNGTVITTDEAGKVKSALDGVLVDVFLDGGDHSPFSLHLKVKWAAQRPERAIDFALVAPNDGHAFLCLFCHGTFGPKLIYSQNCHTSLANDLVNVKEVEITESGNSPLGSRIYKCELKHCLD